MTKAYVNAGFFPANVNARRLKFSILSCSLNFYIMQIQGKVISHFFSKAFTQKK